MKLDRYRILEALRFCAVGVLCVIIDASIFYILHNRIGYHVSIIVGSTVGLIANYFLNICWTFKVVPTIKNAIAVLFAYFINIFIVRMGLMYLFVRMLEITDSYAYPPTLIISVATNFIIVRYIAKKL